MFAQNFRNVLVNDQSNFFYYYDYLNNKQKTTEILKNKKVPYILLLVLTKLL